MPMDRNQRIIPEEAAKLGTPASHGCVRLEVDNAKWIYDYIPPGTPVYIH
ncbi:MAG: L,D-transpeptidase [Thermanaeromonas sp.]|nr:L,D-transpeptidase [Thermanaeromonas sp.]MCG0277681.1 L,D-transpeptidase [Thermanaeromonas sp.]